MFIAAEMGNREMEIAEMEKGKKVRIEFHARRDAALVVLNRLDHELDGNMERLTNKDLEVLLRWKGVLPSKMGNMANRRALYQQFSGNRGDDDLGDPPRWTEADEANLEEPRNALIEMDDTSYGCFEAEQKRDAERAYRKMTVAEKESFRRKMSEMDKADADNEQPPPIRSNAHIDNYY